MNSIQRGRWQHSAISIGIIISLILSVFGLAMMLLPTVARAAEGASISTDKTKYFVGEQMVISGIGFTPGGTVTVAVLRPDHDTEVLTPTADATGAFSTPYTPMPSIPGRFKISATDGVNAATTAATEADAVGIDFKQAANNEKKYGLGNVEWINSILQANDSIYYEGMSVMQRAVLYEIPATDGNTHSLFFEHQAEKSGNAHAYDFLTSWAQAVTAANAISPGGNLLNNINATGPDIEQSLDKTGLVPELYNGPYFVDVNCPDNMGAVPGIVGDVNAVIANYESVYGDRTIRIYANAPISGASVVFNGYVAGYATYHINWTSEATAVYIEFAGHISIGGDGTNVMGYGVGLGASDINGGPYHFKLGDLDGITLGSQDNQLMGASVLIQPGYIIVDKVTDPSGSSQSFTFNTTGTGYTTPFNLTDAAAPHDSGPLAPGIYSVAEIVPAGWDLTSAVATDGSPVSALNLSAGETITVTFTNTQRAKIIVDKVTLPTASSQSFTFTPTGTGYTTPFNLTDAATANDSGWLVPGTYTVTEGAVAGWDLTSVTKEGAAFTNGGDVILGPGDIIHLVFNNTQKAKIRINKVTNPADAVTSFPIVTSWDGTQNIQDTSATYEYESGWLLPGSGFTVSETPPDGWTLTSITCSDGSLPSNIILSPGEIVTVTVTNTHKAKIIVDKVTFPANSAQSFTYTTTGTGYAGFSLTDAALANDSGWLVPGTYTVTEGAVTGWDFTSVTKEGSPFTDGGDVVLGPGDIIHLVYTNTQRGKILVDKVTFPTGSPVEFEFDTDYGVNFFLADATALNDSGWLVPGTYSVAEIVPDGWDLTSGVASDGSPIDALALAPGETITVTFTNTQRGHITVIKTETVGGVTGAPITQYTFNLSGGPDSVNITKTTGVDDYPVGFGNLDFGLLKPGNYTLTEVAVPAGTHSTLQDLGGTLDANTGNVTLSFTLSAGEEKTFNIDNSRPGGGTRTIGYWKNWNTYSHDGAFVARAAKTGNHLADEYLPITIGNLSVTTAQIAWKILSKTALDNTTKNSANDAAYALAAQLLAAKLNVAAGAALPTWASTAITQAQNLLVSANFVGTGEYWKGGKNAAADRATALNLANILDHYNNGTTP